MRALYALALAAGILLSLGGCDTLRSIANPSEIGCTRDEANRCRIIAAAAIVKGAQATIGEQLDARRITPTEAQRLAAITRKATDALADARRALPLTDGTFEQRLAALESILDQLLAEQIIGEAL